MNSEPWKGETAFIIGGGPSVNAVDLGPIKHRNVLGINNAYKLGEWVDVVFAMDCNWWLGTPEQTDGHYLLADDTWGPLYYHPAIKVTQCQRLNKARYPNVHTLKVEQHEGIDTRPGKIACYKHSGHGAINLAVKLGATRLVLVGFDMQKRPQGHNWHSDHTKPVPDDIYQKRFIPALRSTVKPLRERGVEVINACPDSALIDWPRMSLEEYLLRESSGSL